MTLSVHWWPIVIFFASQQCKEQHYLFQFFVYSLTCNPSSVRGPSYFYVPFISGNHCWFTSVPGHEARIRRRLVQEACKFESVSTGYKFLILLMMRTVYSASRCLSTRVQGSVTRPLSPLAVSPKSVTIVLKLIWKAFITLNS